MACAVVIIVNWNGRQCLKRSGGFFCAAAGTRARLIVVADGSTDDSCTWVAAYFPQVQIMARTHSVGFAVANNLALRGPAQQ